MPRFLLALSLLTIFCSLYFTGGVFGHADLSGTFPYERQFASLAFSHISYLGYRTCCRHHCINFVRLSASCSTLCNMQVVSTVLKGAQKKLSSCQAEEAAGSLSQQHWLLGAYSGTLSLRSHCAHAVMATICTADVCMYMPLRYRVRFPEVQLSPSPRNSLSRCGELAKNLELLPVGSAARVDAYW